MDTSEGLLHVEFGSGAVSAERTVKSRRDARAATFHDRFTAVFEEQFPRLYRFLDRVSGEPELAADLAQEAMIKLYKRQEFPDAPEAWLITVAMNLFRNVKAARRRQRRLLTLARGHALHSDPPQSPAEAPVAAEERGRVRTALDLMTQRDRDLLLLRAEGYSYRDIAGALQLNEASVGTLLARARRAFRETYEGTFHAP